MVALFQIHSVLSLLWLIYSAFANTEVTIIERKDVSVLDINGDEYYNLTNSHEFPLYNNNLIESTVTYITLPRDELNYTVLSVNVLPLRYIHHEENLAHQPWNNLRKLSNYEDLESTRRIYIRLDNLEQGVYFTRLCWSAISPVSIDIDQLSNDLFLIKVSPDYYTLDLARSKEFLQDVKLNLHILKNDKQFGLNDDLITIIKFMVTLIIVSFGLRKVLYSLI